LKCKYSFKSFMRQICLDILKLRDWLKKSLSLGKVRLWRFRDGLFILPLLFILGCDSSVDDNPAEKLTSLVNLNVYIADESYKTLLENKSFNLNVPAEVFYFNNRYTGTIEAQGAGSRYFPKWGFTINLTDGNTIEGLTNFNLSIQQYDKAKVRTKLASYIYKQLGFYVFNSFPAFLRINDNNRGLYILTERIDESFFVKRGLNVNELVKVAFGAKFSFSDENHLSDNFEKKIPDDNNFNGLAEFIHALDTVQVKNIFSLNRYFDIEQYMLYHAVSSIMNNTDGLTNNFYLYKKNAREAFSIIPWDFDKTFDPNAGFGLYGENDISKKLFRSDSCYGIYKSLVKKVIDHYFTAENLFPLIDSEYEKIKEAYYLDPYLGMAGMSLENEIGILRNFITERRKQVEEMLLNN